MNRKKQTWEDEAVYAERKKMADDYFERQALIKKEKEAERRKYLNDPKYKAKIELRQLKQRYGLDFFIEKPENFKKLMVLCRKIDGGSRLSDVEVFWLSSEEYFTDALQTTYHKLEAEYYVDQFNKTNGPWNVVNGSSHYRKCNEPNTAESLLDRVNKDDIKNPKLKSALYTVHGGINRDKCIYDLAIDCGKQAHDLTPDDFRPCTLLGAVYMETGHFDLGRTWYEKAEKRGFKDKSVDSELRSIFNKADKNRQIEMSKFLLDWDLERFRWAQVRKRR